MHCFDLRIYNGLIELQCSRENKMEIKKDLISSILFVILIFSIAIDMGGELGVRVWLLPPALFLLCVLTRIKLRSIHYFAFALLVAYPTLLMIGVGVGFNELKVGFSQLGATLFGFFLFLVISNIRDYESLVDGIILAFAIVALIANLVGIGLMFDLPLAVNIVGQLSETQAGYFGERALSDGAVVSNIYFKSTLFMPSVFLLAVCRKKYVAALLLFGACVFAVSKVAVMACAFLALFFIIRFFGLYFSMVVVAMATILSFYFLLDIPIFTEIITVLTGRSDTLDTRVGHYESLVKFWTENPWDFIYGAGLGSSFYSTAAGANVYNIEIDHLNSIRKYGLIWFVLFIAFVARSITLTFSAGSKLRRCGGFSVALAFLLAGTNPVLISPIFFILLAIILVGDKASQSALYAKK